ncbi:Cyclic nucleotide-gated olfactory channel [Hondaea fermentalgiana]|uniref:Cyclic nucleotide-gated olfactory channel n=1 Tax=Hondaea fermentalgiana TaxID=2315210 RepID=A0A2R5GMF2_9STRA|nr:Cyclic nucleotide-gated olfactory channel [Hondaea fermentalgiana]|eukprot:GBG29481.1 Cyclic nucleotide-gated olfactory channel [Hondaea fermentalgiana]
MRAQSGGAQSREAAAQLQQQHAVAAWHSQGYASMAPPRVHREGPGPAVVKMEEQAALDKALSQRQKNREAVRNCRKRKKEHAMQLKERIDELVEENAKLRLELQLGTEGAKGGSAKATPFARADVLMPGAASSSQGSPYQHGGPGGAPAGVGLGEEQELIAEMQVLARKAQEELGGNPYAAANKSRRTGTPKSESEAALRRKVQVYMERHQDHGRDRQKAIGFILGRLQRLVEPEVLTKQYLQMMTSEAAQTSEEDRLTKSLMAELQLTPEQQHEFNKRTRYAKRLRTELDCAFEKMESIVKRCRRNKKVGDSLNELTTILKPEQFARFVVWVHSNPACKDILDELWGKLLTKCDLQINQEILGTPAAVDQIKRFQENSAALAIHLFSIAGSRAREKIAKLCVHPEVVLVDANNNVDKRGVREVTRYMAYVTKAFDTQSCEKTKALRAFDVEERSIISDQQDDKVTGTWRLSGVYIGRLRPRRNNRTSGPLSESPATPFGFGSANAINVPANGFSLPSSVMGAPRTGAQTAEISSARGLGTVESNGAPSSQASSSLPFPNPSPRHSSLSVASASSTPSGAPEPLLTKEEQKQRTVSFNVIVEFSFADPTKPELITEMIISWDAMSLVGQLGLLQSPTKGVLPPPNLATSPVGDETAPTEGPGSAKNQARTEGPGALGPIATSEAGPSGSGKETSGFAERNGAVAASDAHAESDPAGGTTEDSETAANGADRVELSASDAEEARASALRRRNAANLAKLFQCELASERERLAEEILDSKCVFDDIHMGVKYKGIPACLTSDASTTSSRSSSIALNDKVLEVRWDINGFYGGALVDTQQPCKFAGRVFVSTNANSSRISHAKLDIVAQDLMFQLGVLQKPMAHDDQGNDSREEEASGSETKKSPHSVLSGGLNKAGANATKRTSITPSSIAEMSSEEIDSGRASADAPRHEPHVKNVAKFRIVMDAEVASYPWIIDWDNPFRRMWDVMIVIAVVYLCFTVPLQIAFVNFDFNSTFGTFLDILFWIDILLNFRTGFIHAGVHEKNPRKIAEHYLESWFFVDILASIPFELIFGSQSKTTRKSLKILKWLKIPKLLRIGRIFKYLRRYIKFYRLFILGALSMLFVHLFGCFWISIVEPCVVLDDGDEVPEIPLAMYSCDRSEMWRQYLLSLRVSLSVKLQNATLLLLVSVGMSCGFALSVSFFAESVVFAVNRMSTYYEFYNRVDRIKREMVALHLPEDVQYRVSRYYDYLWINQKMGINDENAGLLRDPDLSLPLRKEITLQVHGSLLSQVSLFRDCSDECRYRLATCLRTHVYLPGDIVFNKGELARELYMIRKGVIAVKFGEVDPSLARRKNASRSDASNRAGKLAVETKAMAMQSGFSVDESLQDSETFRLMGPGSFFGEIALLTSLPRSCTVLSKTVSELNKLSKDDFERCMLDFPELNEDIAEEVVKLYPGLQGRLSEFLASAAKLREAPASPRYTDEKQSAVTRHEVQDIVEDAIERLAQALGTPAQTDRLHAQRHPRNRLSLVSHLTAESHEKEISGIFPGDQPTGY